MSKYKSKQQPARILVAEDDRTHQRFVETMLEDMGYNTTIAADGCVVIDLLKSSHFDLVLMDCNMPIMNGYEAARQISELRSDGRIADIPIVALTANQRDGDPEKCFEAGMDDYIAKSLWMPKWKPRIERIINKWLTAVPMNVQNRQAYREEVVSTTLVTKARALAGNRFEALVSSYLSDANAHIKKMKTLAQSRAAADDVILSAYTLTMSSKQIGAVLMTHTAEKISRQASLLSKKGASASSLSADIASLERAYEKTRAALQETLRRRS